MRFCEAQGLGEETVFLDPLDELLERGQSPGEEALAHWHGEWRGSLDRFLETARY
jgi:glutamate--cysteine ligase